MVDVLQAPPVPTTREPGFAARHIGPNPAEQAEMLAAVGAASVEALLDEAIPPAIRRKDPLPLPPAEREHDYLARLWTVASKNQIFRSFIGLGYYDTITPAAILRNVFENPGWYTP
jgi:glycine dehydrogenase